MPNFKFETLTTSELLDIRDYVDELLKSRVVDERREIERTLARIREVVGGTGEARPSTFKAQGSESLRPNTITHKPVRLGRGEEQRRVGSGLCCGEDKSLSTCYR